MSDYTKTTNFAAKDSLPSGNSGKIVKGSEIDTEFTNIQTAVATKANANNAALTGTTTAQTLDISGNVDVDGTLETDALSLNGVTVTSTAAELNILDGVTSTTAELNYVDGVTSNVQTQLNTKAPLASPTFTGTVTAAGLTVSNSSLQVKLEEADGTNNPRLVTYFDSSGTHLQHTWSSGADSLFLEYGGSEGSGTKALGIQGGDISFYEDTGSTPKLFWDASAERLGIGTVSPYSALTVDTANGILNIANGNTSGGTKIQAWAATPANGYLAIEGYDKEYVRIDSSGNVGIGTSSPLAKLDVRSATGNVGFNYGTSSSPERGNLWYDTDGSGWKFNIGKVQSGSFTSQVTIQDNGNVGIGETSPHSFGANQSGLTISDGTGGCIRLKNDAGTANFDIENGGGTGTNLNSVNAFPLKFSTSNTERMRIDASGNVSVSSSAGLIENAIGVFMLPTGELRVKDNTENGTAQISTYNNNVTADAEQFFVGNNLADVDIGNKRGALKFFASSGTERMRIDTNGNLLAGTTSSTNAGKVRIQGATADAADSTVLTLHQNNLNVGGASLIKIGTEANNFAKSAIGFKRTDAYDRGAIIFCQENTGDQSDVDSSDEVMRIDASGNLLVGTITSGYAFQSGVAVNPVNGGSSYVAVAHPDGTGSGNSYALFTYNAGIIGSIAQNGTTGVSYNTSSDQRLKENIADADDAGRKVDAIQVRSFDWIADGTHQDYGMIAQELQSVAPEAVSAPEDPEEMMGVDYSKLVPMLVKEIQSLRNRVAQLENS